VDTSRVLDRSVNHRRDSGGAGITCPEEIIRRERSTIEKGYRNDQAHVRGMSMRPRTWSSTYRPEPNLAELSECSMGGNLCELSTGEALS
jgi:hypothetical protein